MIEDMTVRGFNEHTRRDYVRHVRSFAGFLGPTSAVLNKTVAEIRRFAGVATGQAGLWC
jgi:hypothetical protein